MAACFAGAALLALLGALVVLGSATSSDSDWVVGLITATPALLPAAVLVLVGRSVQKSEPTGPYPASTATVRRYPPPVGAASWHERYRVRPLGDYEHDPYWNRRVFASKWSIRLFVAFTVGLPVMLVHSVAGRAFMAVLGAALLVPFLAVLALSAHGLARRALGRLSGPFSDWNNAAWGRGFRLAWRRSRHSG